MPETDHEPIVRPGRRVICHKVGSHDGARGRVVSVWGGVAQVAFQTSTVVAPVECFEPVGGVE